MTEINKYTFTFASADHKNLDKVVEDMLAIESPETSVEFKALDAITDDSGVRSMRRRVIVRSSDEDIIDAINHIDIPRSVSVRANGYATNS
jgi:ribosomal protein S10